MFQKIGGIYIKKYLVTFALVSVLVLSACGESNGTAESANNESDNVEEAKQAEDVEEVDSEEVEEEAEDLTREEELNQLATTIVEDSYNKTSISEMRVNENMGSDEENYIVLANLSFDVKNSPKMALDMIDMYASDLAAQLGEESDVYQVVSFWEFPYMFDEGEVVVKRTYTREKMGMVLTDEVTNNGFYE
ncbi:hypothetical protein MKY91_17315 [Alkalicoccobacillus gibsonii]|uniref:DUF5067 domain-containing protein n=1 Tax=Alkalicoccobacillus gibsonii TaxID=79881 RepID=A0ABU9VLY7_9BACI